MKVIKNILFLSACTAVLIMSGRVSAHEFLTGYKVTVLTRVYEDGSLSVRYELNLDPDAAETIAHKRLIFSRNGYELTEQKKENAYIMTAARTFSPDGSPWKDEMSEWSVTCRNDTFYYQEDFFNFLIHDEISGSDLKKDSATAKVLMADTEYLFRTILPGRVLESSAGQILKDTVQWQYDIEQLFGRRTINMSASSRIERDEDVAGALMLIAILILAVSLLLWIRNKSLTRFRDPA